MASYQLSSLIRAMLEAGMHRLTRKGQGMTEEAYRRLWLQKLPKQDERFPVLVLVDRTIALATLVQARQITVSGDLRHYRDRAPVPFGSNGKPLDRYILLADLGARYLNQSVEQSGACRLGDELGLSVYDGVFASIQHSRILRTRGLDLPGSYHRVGTTPAIEQLGIRTRPHLCHLPSHRRSLEFGTAVRSTTVLAVSPSPR